MPRPTSMPFRTAHTHTHTHGVGFARAKNHSATEKRRKVKFLLFFFFSLRAPLMCPADSETGFGRRRRRGSQPRWPPNIRAKRRLRWKWNGLSPGERAGKCPFSVFTTTKAAERHNNNNNRSGAPNRNLVRRSAFGFRLPD